ncbi:hypothetical protein FPANT_8938 [Fusarium pseudoanthophilum]|uniref:Apple domain-containing protein n=1 Tax=Fusarium pseudoanthophilum TaxID=48495 RepID=A0A8H5KY71_9HYPO|nr:hypothetical protein FPANT_8938 [Fusarium pseudoanthophilum]
MVAIRSFFIFSAAAGIASAGKCKPESRSSSIVPVASSTGSASVSVIESSTTLADTTTQTSLTKSATETASSETASASGSGSATIIESSTTLADTTVESSIAESTASSATSADISTTESKLTTFLTSFTTSNADTTTEAATTTTAASGPVVTCPSEVDQCLGTMEIQCDVLLGGLNNPSILADMNACAQQCNSDTTCRAFTYNQNMHECFIVTTQEIFAADVGGWVAGIKGTCGETTESSSTVFTSTAETTTTEAATTTTLAPADPTCPSTVKQCAGDSAVLCDVQLDNLVLAGFSNDILECASFCDQDDDCAGFSRVRSSGGCFKAIALIADVHRTDRDGWDSGIKFTCGQEPEPTTTAFTSTAGTTTTEAATTTTAAAPPVDNCPPETGICFGSAQIQCDVSLYGGNLVGGGSISQCALLCLTDGLCTGFSRRRGDGACYITFDDPVATTENEGWDTGVVGSCAT